MLKTATAEDLTALTRLALLLWPDHDSGELRQEIGSILADQNAVFFLALIGGEPVGFAQCQLRFDYVEGTQSSPVGYLEGIFVREEHRGRGLAKALLARCEQWSGERGCSEFASDCELSNTASLQFHLKAGFEEANRIICFKKRIGSLSSLCS